VEVTTPENGVETLVELKDINVKIVILHSQEKQSNLQNISINSKYGFSQV
jgi:hypothetical protein